MRLDRRHPCLHERRFDAKGELEVCVVFDAAEATALQARMPAVQPVGVRSSSIRRPVTPNP